MTRRTKIVATLGPATDDSGVLEQLLLAGVNVVRLNFSHGQPADHQARAERVRTLAARHGLYVAILGDLQGPKIRIARFRSGSIPLGEGDRFVLDTRLDKGAGDRSRVGVDYPQLADDCRPGDQLLLDDGRLQLEIESIGDGALHCLVTMGGTLSNNKGINRLGGGLSAAALTDKDRRDIRTAAQIGVDYLAVSFPRAAADIEQARALLEQAGGQAGLIAKIERAETVNDPTVLEQIIQCADGVMVARGDLGVEIGDAELMAVQKHLIDRARKSNKVVITATQMMESMIQNPQPTRAEVFDVANAVLDGTDAVMLSAETASGRYPVAAVAAMDRVIRGAERHPGSRKSKHRVHQQCSGIDESVALSAMYAANHLEGVKGIICMTESGYTPLVMSRIRSPLPIFAFSGNPRTQSRVSLFRGVQSVSFNSDQLPNEEVNAQAVAELERLGVVAPGDRVIVTKGNYVNAQGGTNTLKILTVGDNIQ